MEYFAGNRNQISIGHVKYFIQWYSVVEAATGQVNLQRAEAHDQCHRSKKILAHRDTYGRFIFHCQTHTTGVFHENQQV